MESSYAVLIVTRNQPDPVPVAEIDQDVLLVRRGNRPAHQDAEPEELDPSASARDHRLPRSNRTRRYRRR
jgi:hypothetical protein